MSCEYCSFRAKYDENPNSFLGKLWRWHIAFCPGWKTYFRNLPDAERYEVSKRYQLAFKAEEKASG